MEQELHKVRAESLNGAYDAMREKYGPSAVVLGTTQVREGGIMGLGGRRMFELTVAVPAARDKSPVERRYAAQAQPAKPSPAGAVEDVLEDPPIGSDQRFAQTVAHFQNRLRWAREDREQQAGSAETPRYEQEHAETSAGHLQDAAAQDLPGLEPRRTPQRMYSRTHAPRPDGRRASAAAQPQEEVPQPQQAELNGAVAVNPAPASRVVPFRASTGPADAASSSLRRELAEIREALDLLTSDVPGGGLPEKAAPYYRDLLTRGMVRKHALSLLGKVYRESSSAEAGDPKTFCARLRAEVGRQIRATGGIELVPGHTKAVALVGTTGTGKTTSLAKIAAHFALRRKVRVALVTTDTYRIAAAQQLQVYADIIGLPMRIANDAGELRSAVDAFKDSDLILLDTPGGSPFNVQYLRELQGMLAGAGSLESMLVLSAASQADDLAQAIDNLRSLRPSSILFTKLDETRRFGMMYSVLKDTGWPVSYLCVGQNVPDDIRIAQPHALAGLVVEGKSHRGGSSE